MTDTRDPIAVWGKIFADMPGEQLALVVLFFAVSVIGGNGVFALHYRRVGKPVMKSPLSWTNFPLLDFNAKEWALLLLVFGASMGIVMAAVAAGN